jgi:hypothetical protein
MANFYRTGLNISPYLPQRWFWVILTLAICKRYFFHFSGLRLLDNYLLDLLCMPIVLEICTFSMRLILVRPIQISKAQAVFAVLYTSLWFEVILPKQRTGFYCDAIDVFLYALGAFAWFNLCRRSREWSKKNLFTL